MLKLALFDLAGTTLLDNDLMEGAFLRVFHARNMPVHAEEILPFRGSAKKPIAETMVSRYRPEGGEELISEIMHGFEQGLEEGLRASGQSIPGTEATFRWLRERGIKIGVTTGFSRKIKDIVMEVLGWDERLVDVTACSDEVPESRPAPWMIFEAMRRADVYPPSAVMTVGDTPRDLQAGTNAGCGFVVGVLSGSGTVETLGRERHTHLLGSVAEIPAMLERYL
ncbi:MAG: HAD-IA family hydrolase [Armatimonadia bacterium]